MNEIVNKFLLARDKCIPEMQLKQPRFTYSACGPFTKNKERIQKFMQTRNINYICKNDEACFHDDVAYRNYKDYTDLLKTTESDKLLRDGAFKIASNTKYDGYERGLASMVYKFFDKKSAGSGIKSVSNQQLADELHKPIIRKCKTRKANSSFKDNIWGADLADMELQQTQQRIKENKENQTKYGLIKALNSITTIFKNG